VGANNHRPLSLVQARLQSLAISGEPQPEPGGQQAGLAWALLGCLAALPRLTRLTSLTVDALGPDWHGGLEGRGAPAWDVLRPLPPGLKQVGHCVTVVGRGCRGARRDKHTSKGHVSVNQAYNVLPPARFASTVGPGVFVSHGGKIIIY
jgi:hypothetical protein